MDINQIVTIGNITTVTPVNENLNELTMEIQRLSGKKDRIKVLSEGNLTGSAKVYGEIRSRQKNGLNLYVYSELIEKSHENDENEAIIEGYVCKEPYHKRVCNRLITSLMIAYNGNRNHYIPVVTWGRTALFAKELKEGDKVVVTGRLQERTFIKDGKEKTVCEVSAKDLALANANN